MKEKYSDEKWIGKRFERLTVIAFEKVNSGGSNRVKWIVRCDCGTLKSVDPRKVISENTQSCGCMKSEKIKESNIKNKTKHGGRYDRLYAIWHNMKQRCYCETYKDYVNWGNRGIRVCDEWKDNYVAFRDWALLNGYEQGLSLDRIDVNGDYSPTNCRWADWHTQAVNRTTSLNFEINGEIMNLSDIAKEYKIQYGTLYNRVCVYQWPLKKAISTPVRDNNSQNKEWRERYGNN